MATTHFIASFFTHTAIVAAIVLMGAGLVFAHCDTMDGPIIKTAQKALETGDVSLVLMWIQKMDEAELTQAFKKAREVRKKVSSCLVHERTCILINTLSHHDVHGGGLFMPLELPPLYYIFHESFSCRTHRIREALHPVLLS